MALAASKKLVADRPELQVRVVIGYMLGLNKNIGKNDIEKMREEFVGLRNYSDFETPFHAWIETSHNNFSTSKVIDLTYSFPHEDRGNIDNFSEIEAKKEKLKHVAIVTATREVKTFFYYLLKSQLRDEAELESSFQFAVNHLR